MLFLHEVHEVKGTREDEFDAAMPEALAAPDLWWPTFTPGRQCSHDSPAWRWNRNVDGTYCDWCKAKLSDVALPDSAESCLWWTYHGSMGRGEAPRSHPDDCRWCAKEGKETE